MRVRVNMCLVGDIFSNMAAVNEQLTEKYGTKLPVRNYFSLLTDENRRGVEPDSPICKVCHTQVRAKSSNTSNLLSHLKNRHMHVYKELKAKMEDGRKRETCFKDLGKNQPTLSSVISRNQPYERNGNQWSQLTDSITRWIPEDGLPLYTLEKSGIKKMLAEFDVRYTIPSRNYFSRMAIPSLYESSHKIVCQEIWAAEYFSATTGMWSSVGMMPYLSYTVDFVDSDWKLQSRCLQTEFMPEDHTAANLSVPMADILAAWEMNPIQQGCITIDNGSNIICACNKLN